MPDTDDPTQHFPAPGQGGDGWVIGNRYRVTGRIGAGGMADVFRAHDELLNRDVAVKVFRSVAAGADTAAGAERQRAELHALARLNHPNLITLYDGSVGGPDEPESRAYLVMELVEGPNLGDRIDQGPLPTESEVRVIGTQVADALAYVHDQGMVHRDIKPANILLGAGTGGDQVRARLSDFGIVRLLGAERLTQADSTLGTASYLAPEQARGSGVGPPADIYALGLTLIEALTGVRSFDGATPLEAVVARLDRDPTIPEHLPQPWPGLLTGMTARDPAARPTARQVADALRSGGTTQFVPAAVGAGLVTGATTVIPAAAPMPPVRRPVDIEPAPLPVAERRPRNVGMIVGLILAAVIALLGAVIVIATTGNDNGGGAGGGETATPSATTSQRTTSSSSQAPTTEASTEPSEEQTTEETTQPPTRTQTRTVTQSSEPTTTQPSTPPSSTRASSTASSSSTSAQAGNAGAEGTPLP